MDIRLLTAADIPVLRALAIKIFRDTFSDQNTPETMDAFIEQDYSVASFQREFEQHHAWCYMISEGERPVGYIRLRENPEVEHLLGANTLELQRIYVDHDFHGRKVGDQLMQFSIDRAREMKRDWLWLGVWELNPRAQRFYEKWGFEKFSEHIFRMGEEEQTDWLYKLKL